ncbi:protein of unknown function [Sinosporangium album]|uniref:DUF4326 domain-containing protein n=1 Tax=Sinosporangium album TaxID=504805 RepID=A0A1G8EDH6_9ACTN|nr:DUF4326 domain-containing protein [Sinosporangium album]SDH67916.1 protein of unknown function [Sinosporangium album]
MTTSQALAPNPYSPYATADPATRHVFPALFGIAPQPNVLALAACEQLAVVPAEPLIDADPSALPAGLCPTCVDAVKDCPPPRRGGQVAACRFCEMQTTHDGAVCALCRQEFHDDWQRIRPLSDTTPDGATPMRVGVARPEQVAAGARLPDGARLVDDTTPFANPFTVEWAIGNQLALQEDDARIHVVDLYRKWLTLTDADTKWPHLAERRAHILARLPDLKGRPLACTCDADKPCCGDALLDLANRDGEQS